MTTRLFSVHCYPDGERIRSLLSVGFFIGQSSFTGIFSSCYQYSLHWYRHCKTIVCFYFFLLRWVFFFFFFFNWVYPTPPLFRAPIVRFPLFTHPRVHESSLSSNFDSLRVVYGFAMSLTRIVNAGKFLGLSKLMDLFSCTEVAKNCQIFCHLLLNISGSLWKIRRTAFENVSSRVYTVLLTEFLRFSCCFDRYPHFAGVYSFVPSQCGVFLLTRSGVQTKASV